MACNTAYKLQLLLATSFVLLTVCPAKHCKVVEEVSKLQESPPFSGQLVRRLTQTTRYQECSKDLPNCCGMHGCCDSKGTKALFIIFVAGLFAVLFIAFISVFIYSTIFHRKTQKGKEEVKVAEQAPEPRYNIDTYLAMAGYQPDAALHEGPAQSAIQPLEHHGPQSSSGESSGSDERA